MSKRHRQPQPPPAPPAPAPAVSPPPAKPAGIRCPRCGCRDLLTPQGIPVRMATPDPPWNVTKVERRLGYIRRRRVCRHCGTPVFTREMIETRNPLKE